MSNYMTHKSTRAGRAETLKRREIRRIKQNGWMV